ncbi:N-acetylmuramoyl-L-alanine amidase [Anaerospora sp.]|jgi:N-acetylmuramoyl-L-alanine amidase|uniref:N-acetylmuramoyl-L-alanine amidase family protein n=1 Tax=Anaerospora sp. TaxID=1960278 RepID=UPI0028A0C1F1|nr:N-acetylmuramoyl-L-alanine amidase [Anaerospora sp.]
MKIAINGGHYPGLDSGAVGATGLQEAIVTQDLMKRVARYLRTVWYDVTEIQENELYQITDASNVFGAELFISIHCNSAASTSARGTETYCYQLGGTGERLAGCIQSQIVKSLGTVDRGVKTANFAVIRDTDCPAVLVEAAFISNKEDEKLLADSTKRDEFAKAIARGITDLVAMGL